MNGVFGAIGEVWGLFVDDGALALGLLLWCAVAGLLLPALSIPSEICAVLFCLGCAVILAATVLAAAWRKRVG